MSGFLGVPVGAAYHLVSALTSLLTPVAGGLAAVAAIVLFTAAVRLLLSPLSLRALRGQAAMARLMPQVQALRTRYSRQPERFKRELSALYQREGVGPFAGLLPVLAQWPFLSVTYLLFRSATVDGTRNHLLSAGLFGVHDAVFVAILAILAALCWLSARLAKRSAPGAAATAGTGTTRRAGRVPGAPAGAANSKKPRGAGAPPARRGGLDPAEALADS